jgi:cupin 2 domain-containing protein
MNIKDSLPLTLTEEQFQTLAQKGNVKIERILSYGQATPTGEWYDQRQDEWVMLVQGEARLEYDDGSQIDLKKGDYVMIPAHTKHRVAWTIENELTIWLAVHF